MRCAKDGLERKDGHRGIIVESLVVTRQLPQAMQILSSERTQPPLSAAVPRGAMEDREGKRGMEDGEEEKHGETRSGRLCADTEGNRKSSDTVPINISEVY